MKRFNYNLVFLFILLAFQSACGQSQSVTDNERNSKADVRVVNAKKQVEEMFKVVIDNRDYGNIGDYAPQEAFAVVGGREKFIEILSQAYKNANDYFKESLVWSVGEPENLTGINNDLFVIIPRTLNGVSPSNTNVTQKGSIIGISNDNGKTWKFINGKSFDKIYPLLAGKFQIPKEQTFINGIEQ